MDAPTTNKPKIFLSHSKKDIEFINLVDADLRRSGIETWIDEFEIEAGKSFMSSIFEDGIASCDAFFIYFSPYSIDSQFVWKEIDAGLVHKLSDDSVSFLPFINDSSLRSNLRLDLQAIQIPVWNERDYSTSLGKCVSGVWRGFHNKRMKNAVSQERARRLQAEAELQEVLKVEKYAGVSFEEMWGLLRSHHLSEVFSDITHLISTGCEFHEIQKGLKVDSAKCREYMNSLVLLGLVKREFTPISIDESIVEYFLTDDAIRFGNSFSAFLDAL